MVIETILSVVLGLGAIVLIIAVIFFGSAIWEANKIVKTKEREKIEGKERSERLERLGYKR